MEKSKKLVENNVIWCQTTLVETLIAHGLISEYPFVTENEIMEWWLVNHYLALKLNLKGEAIIEELGCYWWGRQTSGQSVYMDQIICAIAESID